MPLKLACLEISSDIELLRSEILNDCFRDFFAVFGIV